MPTKNSSVFGVRVMNPVIKEIEKAMKRKGWSRNKWINWAIGLGLKK